MIVLHSGWTDGRVWLWAEAAAKGGDGKRPRGKGKTAVLPCDGGFADVAAAFEGAVGIKLKKSLACSRAVWLPTRRGVPVPSSGLIAEVPAGRGKPTIAPWLVTAVPLTAEQAGLLLCYVADKPTLAPGVLVGRDVAFLVAGLRLAGALVARQQFVPGIAKTSDGWHARWEPIFAGDDAKRLADLAAQMPGAVRAMAGEDGALPQAPAASVLEAFVGCMADWLVRGTAMPGTERRGGKRPAEFDSLHD